MKFVVVAAFVLVVYLRPANGFIFICITMNAYNHVCAVVFCRLCALA